MEFNVTVPSRYGKETAASLNHYNEITAKKSFMTSKTPESAKKLSNMALSPAASSKLANIDCDFSQISEFMPEEIKHEIKKKEIGRNKLITNYVSPRPNLRNSIMAC